MFSDISGFTTLAEKMDPESVRDLMNRCFDRLVPCIQHNGGTIDKFIGDEIMALFGAPQAHENDAERALRATMEMAAELEKFNIENQTSLGLHFGVNTGLVLTGGIGSSGQQEYSVMGDAVNLASRLVDASGRGQVLVGADTHRLTAPLFEFMALPPISAKGKAIPVAAYRLIGPKLAPASTRGLERNGLSSPLVGRKKEFKLIQKRIIATADGHGGIVGVIGEAGLGKSRLLAELHQSVQNVQWLEGKMLSYGQSISYWPFQEILRNYAGIREDDSELQAWQKLENKIVALFPDSALDILPYLATLLAVKVQGEYVERVKYLNGDALGKRLFLAMRRFVERLARVQPLVLVFEDVHWMDISSMELLEHVLPLVRAVPLLLIGVSRPENDLPGAHLEELCVQEYADFYTEVQLAPLSQSESAQLVNNLLAIDDLPARVYESITQKAEGNPFFLEEIVRSLLDMGVIVRSPSGRRWRATKGIESVQIPDTIKGVLMTRIDRLDEDVKQALRVAAVIGRSFLYRILYAVDEADNALDKHLTQLQQVELIRTKRIAPELEYIFKHALAQEATYESILIQERRELHERVAESIETLFSSRLDEFYSLLAYHYAKAENWEKAQEYLFKSGDQAGHMAADAEALTHYQQAMQAYVKAFGDKWDPIQRARVDRKMGEVLYRRGNYQQAKEYFHQALANFGHPLPQTRWAVRIAILRDLLQQAYHRLFPPSPEKMSAMGNPEGFEDETAIYLQLGLIDTFSNLEKTLLDALRGLNRAEMVGAKDSLSMGMAGISYACTSLNLIRLPKLYLDQALQISQTATDAPARGFVFDIAGVYYYLHGQLTEAQKYFELSKKVYSDIGNLVELASVESQLANIKFVRGDFRSARSLCEQNVDMAREMQNIQTECYFQEGVAKSSSMLGDWEDVVEQMLCSIELCRKIPNYLTYVETLGYLAWHYLRAGMLEKAFPLLEEAQLGIQKYRTYGQNNMQVYNTYAEACLLKAQQDQPEKKQWLRKTGYWLKQGWKQGQSARIYITETMRLRGTYEWLQGRPAHARHWWERSLQEADTMGERYFAALTHMEMGARLGDPDHLQKAESIFEEVGARPDLEKVRGLLKK